MSEIMSFFFMLQFCNVFSSSIGRQFLTPNLESIMSFVLIIIKAGTASSKDIFVSLFYSGVSPREKQAPHSKVTALSRTTRPDTCFTA